MWNAGKSDTSSSELAVGVVGLVAIVGSAIWIISMLNEDRPSVGSSDTVQSCVSRGIAYFQEIGSYPSLSDGRSAIGVASERCNRTTTAF
jgi:hypothetical protein